MGLLYGCFATILLCAWSMLHLNVPTPSDSAGKKFLRKVKWTLYGIIAPEIIATTAITERWQARRKCKRTPVREFIDEFWRMAFFDRFDRPFTHPQHTLFSHLWTDMVSKFGILIILMILLKYIPFNYTKTNSRDCSNRHRQLSNCQLREISKTKARAIGSQTSLSHFRSSGSLLSSLDVPHSVSQLVRWSYSPLGLLFVLLLHISLG